MAKNYLLKRKREINIMIAILLTGLFLFGNFNIYIATYCCFGIIMGIRLWIKKYSIKVKINISIAFILIAGLQIVFCINVIYGSHDLNLMYFLRKLFAAVIVLLPVNAEYFITSNRYAEYYLPSVEDISAIGFYDIKRYKESILNTAERFNKTRKSLSVKNIKEAISDLNRHGFNKYVNKGTLTLEYFKKAFESLEDLNVYIVISNTGTAASEIISVFTQKQYNHTSLSFDKDLETLLSYNGGANIYPPGLNAELIEMLHKKADASILVYSLPVSKEAKQKMINKVMEINNDGSAYNLLGLVTKHSAKPNIMFCSQFVYKMLEHAEVNYFQKNCSDVRPMDFIEQDIYRCLKYEYEIRFDASEAK